MYANFSNQCYDFLDYLSRIVLKEGSESISYPIYARICTLKTPDRGFV